MKSVDQCYYKDDKDNRCPNTNGYACSIFCKGHYHTPQHSDTKVKS